MCMESRKMVLMYLFAGQQWRCRHREQLREHSREGKSRMNWETSMETDPLHMSNREQARVCCVTWGVQPSALWQPRGVEGGGRWERGSGGGDVRIPVAGLCWCVAEAQHNTVEQLSSRTARRSNQSILKEVSPGCSLEGLMLKLRLQYFGHLMWRAGSLEKDPEAGKDWGQEEKGMTEDEMVGWHHWLRDMSLSGLQELVMDRGPWRAAVHGVEKILTWLSDWTELYFVLCFSILSSYNLW